MYLEIVRRQCITFLDIDKLKGCLLLLIADLIETFGVLCHSLGLHHCSLIALALQDSLLTLVLLDLWNLTCAIISLIATVALRRARPLSLVATLSRIMPFLHDVCLRNMMRL